MEVDISRNNSAVQFYQYDYGQSITFSGFLIPDETEAHFYKDTSEFKRYVEAGKVLVPDSLLKSSGSAVLYLYVDNGEMGKTIKKITITIFPRARPQDYVEPEPENTYSRHIPVGGNTGDVLAKKSENDFDVEWVRPSGGTDTIEAISNEDIDTIIGKE